MATESSARGDVLLLVTNDTHSKMVPYVQNELDGGGDITVGGVARRTSYFKQRQHEQPLILDVGDSFQGSPYYSFFGGEVELAAMERMQYKASAIGNHDFDSGLAELQRHAREQSPNLKLLCANVIDEATGSLVFEPHTIYEVGESKWKVGIVALMGDEAWSVVDKKLREGLKLTDPFTAARQSVEQLKADGAELLVCLSHTGVDEARGASNDAALAELGLFDVVFSGHAHFKPRDMEMRLAENGKTLLHPGVHNGQAVVWAKFSMERHADGAACTCREGGADLIDSTYADDEEMVLWLQGYAVQFEAILNEEVGTCVGFCKYSSPPAPPINFEYHSSLADALLTTCAEHGAHFSAINSAGIRSDMPEGSICYKHVEACWPWKNNAHRCEVSGELVLELLDDNAAKIAKGLDDGMFLHFAGLDYRVQDGRPVHVMIGGQPLEVERWYGFVADGYLVCSTLSGYPAAATGQRNVQDCGMSTQSCILDQIKALHAQGRKFGSA